jgi:hypothetical protein
VSYFWEPSARARVLRYTFCCLLLPSHAFSIPSFRKQIKMLGTKSSSSARFLFGASKDPEIVPLVIAVATGVAGLLVFGARQIVTSPGFFPGKHTRQLSVVDDEELKSRGLEYRDHFVRRYFQARNKEINPGELFPTINKVVAPIQPKVIEKEVKYKQ